MAKRILTGLVTLFVLLSAYQAAQVYLAHTRTPGLFKPFLAENFAGIRWQELSETQQKALIKVEDPNFFSHNGLDFSTPGAGLTTITQALAKRLYFKNFKPGFGKIKQSLIAWLVIDKQVRKEDQLTTFLNLAYFGHSDGYAIIGFAEATEHYFNKSLAELNEDEFLQLVGMLIAPNDLSPAAGSIRVGQRLRRVKNYLAGACTPHSLTDTWLENCNP